MTASSAGGAASVRRFFVGAPRGATAALSQRASLPAVGASVLREPYRVLFPLGVAIAWAGVLPWLLFALAVTDDYRSIFHSMAQVQGFLACFASGFLLTMIPRRTASGPLRPWQLAVAVAAPIGLAAFAFLERWALAQLFWVALLALLIGFAARRFPRATTPAPASFVWVPFALLAGLAGAVLAGVGAAKGDDWFWLHDVGRGLVLQGVFGSLVAGVGGALLPHLTRGEGQPLQASGGVAERALHAFAAVVFLGSFFVEVLIDVRLGYALRALCAGGALVIEARLWRRPSLPGAQRWLAWFAGWALPIGFALSAALPERRQIGMHVVFLGSFGLLVFAVGTHVALAHAGQSLASRPRPLALLGLFVVAAVAARALLVVDIAHYRLWLGIASASFLAATLCWASVAGAALRGPAAGSEQT